MNIEFFRLGGNGHYKMNNVLKELLLCEIIKDIPKKIFYPSNDLNNFEFWYNNTKLNLNKCINANSDNIRILIPNKCHGD